MKYKMFISNSVTESTYVELDVFLNDKEFNDLPNTPLFSNDSVKVIIYRADEKDAVKYTINPYHACFRECTPEELVIPTFSIIKLTDEPVQGIDWDYDSDGSHIAYTDKARNYIAKEEDDDLPF